MRAKEHLESIQEQIAIKRNTLAALHRELEPDLGIDARDKLLARRDTLVADLRSHSSVLEVFAQSKASFDDRLGEATRQREAAKFALSSAERRLADLHRLGQELKAEVGILEMNEVAADAFRTLCGYESCQFFRRPEESYGRRLLYLKDQVKDFQSSFSTLERDVESLRRDVTQAEDHLQHALQEKEHSIAETRAGQLVPVIDAITKELAEVNLRLERIGGTAKEQKRFDALIDRAVQLEEEVSQLRPTRGERADQTRLTDVRNELGRCYGEWLTTLRAQNIPERIGFDDDFRLHLGDERFSENSPFSGSTRTRIVLAYHAAMVETSLKTGGCHPGFLVLDAPKQHELHAEDLGAFVRRFRDMVASQPIPVQLVIAATEQDFVDEKLADALWRPAFGTRDEPRFLGARSGQNPEA